MTQIKPDWFFKKALDVSEDFKTKLLRTEITLDESGRFVRMILIFSEIRYTLSFPIGDFHDATNVEDFFHEKWASLFRMFENDIKT